MSDKTQGFDKRKRTLKRAVVDGTLEHLFEEKELRQFFADWKADSQLKTAYDEAQLWADTQAKKVHPG